MIIPKRHVNFLETLTHTELLEMYKLIDIRTKKLHTKHKGVSILLRDGLVKNPLINKSVNHLHIHLLPNIPVYIGNDPANRIWLEDKIYAKTAQRLKKIFL